MSSAAKHPSPSHPVDGVCWWCRQQPADSHEHKFKRSDLARMGGKSDELLWGTTNGVVRAVRSISKRQVVRFDKTMCAYCNNTRSQSFDRAYKAFSKYLYEAAGSLRRSTGIDFTQVYGRDWRASQLDLARYYCKHFGCRSVADGLSVPTSVRNFPDAATVLPDVQLGLVTSAQLRRNPTLCEGLSLSPNVERTDRNTTHFTSTCMAAYVGYIGVRYEWRNPDRWPAPPDSFFGHSKPILNHFHDDEEVLDGTRLGLLRRLTRSAVGKVAWL